MSYTCYSCGKGFNKDKKLWTKHKKRCNVVKTAAAMRTEQLTKIVKKLTKSALWRRRSQMR